MVAPQNSTDEVYSGYPVYSTLDLEFGSGYPVPMTYEEIEDALDGLCAYDHGATDSGIKDEALRERVIPIDVLVHGRSFEAPLLVLGHLQPGGVHRVEDRIRIWVGLSCADDIRRD